MKEAHPDVPIVTAALDSHLNEKGISFRGLAMQGTACSAQNSESRPFVDRHLIDCHFLHTYVNNNDKKSR